jgi:hypothetical protein
MTNGIDHQWKLVAFACVLALLMGIASVIAANAEPGETRILKKLLGAVEVNDYDSFVADGNAAFKAGLTKQMLESVSIQLSTRMKKGYDTTYLGQLKQQWGQVYLWKLVYKDDGDDTLVKLVQTKNKLMTSIFSNTTENKKHQHSVLIGSSSLPRNLHYYT